MLMDTRQPKAERSWVLKLHCLVHGSSLLSLYLFFWWLP
jgi:hypothetical protein